MWYATFSGNDATGLAVRLAKVSVPGGNNAPDIRTVVRIVEKPNHLLGNGPAFGSATVGRHDENIRLMYR